MINIHKEDQIEMSFFEAEKTLKGINHSTSETLFDAMARLKDMHNCACEIDEEDDWLDAWSFEVSAYNIIYRTMSAFII